MKLETYTENVFSMRKGLLCNIRTAITLNSLHHVNFLILISEYPSLHFILYRREIWHSFDEPIYTESTRLPEFFGPVYFH